MPDVRGLQQTEMASSEGDGFLSDSEYTETYHAHSNNAYSRCNHEPQHSFIASEKGIHPDHHNDYWRHPPRTRERKKARTGGYDLRNHERDLTEYAVASARLSQERERRNRNSAEEREISVYEEPMKAEPPLPSQQFCAYYGRVCGVRHYSFRDEGSLKMKAQSRHRTPGRSESSNNAFTMYTRCVRKAAGETTPEIAGRSVSSSLSSDDRFNLVRRYWNRKAVGGRFLGSMRNKSLILVESASIAYINLVAQIPSTTYTAKYFHNEDNREAAGVRITEFFAGDRSWTVSEAQPKYPKIE
ncbi:hypothetical protein B0H11DRAFT_1931172 [Mycena galericulata]|nr:hypothetical protein B0H11DRAFT_1931172 [Mycena galericulata]